MLIFDTRWFYEHTHPLSTQCRVLVTKSSAWTTSETIVAVVFGGTCLGQGRALTHYTIQYDFVYLMCSKKLTCSQLSPPSHCLRHLMQHTETKQLTSFLFCLQSHFSILDFERRLKSSYIRKIRDGYKCMHCVHVGQFTTKRRRRPHTHTDRPRHNYKGSDAIIRWSSRVVSDPRLPL